MTTTTREQLVEAAEAAGWTIDPTYPQSFRAELDGRTVHAQFSTAGAVTWASTERGALYGPGRREMLVEHIRAHAAAAPAAKPVHVCPDYSVGTPPRCPWCGQPSDRPPLSPTYVAECARLGVDPIDPQVEADELGECRWFAGCGQPATHNEPHPVLGEVPACDRCPTIGRTD